MRVFIVLLALVATGGCTTDSNEPDIVVPTSGLFEVLTATPHPTATSAPTPIATTVPSPTPVPLEAQPFPSRIDPDIVSERPSDIEILNGWTEFLTNVQWNFKALDGSIITGHLCGDGSVYWNDMLDGRGQDWSVQINPSKSSDEWGHVLVETKVSEFRSNTYVYLERSAGAIWADQGEIEFSGSRQCLELAAE